MKIKYNTKDDCLYCIECKNIIHIGEKYVVVREYELDERIQKEYHLECVPAESDEDDINDLFDQYSENTQIVDEDEE